MSGWGQYPESGYGQQQGGQQQSYGAQGQQQADAHGGYGDNQVTGYQGAQMAGPVQDNNYVHAGYGAKQSSAGAVQPSYGAQQSAAYGYNQQGTQGGAVAQAAQGLAPDQQARVSQIVAQMGGSGGQSGYGTPPYQGMTQESGLNQYGGSAAQPAYGAAQPVAQTYAPGQSYASQQSPVAAQQGYGNAVQSVQQGYNSGLPQSSQQGYGSTSYGSSQQGPTAYTQQQQPQQAQQAQQPPSYNAQTSYQAHQASLPSSGTYGAQQSDAVYGRQAVAASQGYGPQTSQVPYATQQPMYNQQAPRSSLPGAQQSGVVQQPAYGTQGGPRASYQAPYGGQYGANQYASQQAAAPSQAAITMPARPQQATQVGTYNTTSYSRPSAQPRMTAAPAAAAPAFGRPSVQAPAGSRANAISRPSTQPAAAKPALPAASAGRMGAATAKPLPSNARTGRPAAVGQSAKEIARLADSIRDKRDDSRGRERTREPDKERSKERVTVGTPQGSVSKDRDRDRDREPARSRKPAPASKASPPRRREPDYLVRLSTRPVTALERDYNDIVDRYPRLYVSADFAKSVSCWVQAAGFSEEPTLWPLHEPVTLQHEMDFETADSPAPVSQTGPGIKFNARVMLMQGLDEAARKEWAKGTHHGGQHLHHLLKFLTVRHEVDNLAKGRTDRSGIMAVGGSYDAALDGPLKGEAGAPKALIDTCIRHARSNLGIDLSSCSQWMRFLEVHYQRPASTMTPPAMETSEVTVLLMANAKTMFDKDWTSVWEDQQAWLKHKQEHEAAQSKKAKEAEEDRARVKAEEDAKEKIATAKVPPSAPADTPDTAGHGALSGQARPAANGPGDEEQEGEEVHKEPAAKRAKTEAGMRSTKAGKSDGAAAGTQAAEDSAAEVDVGGVAKHSHKDEAVPEHPRLLIRGRKFAHDRWRSASVSLDGLLDYDEEDRDEPTLELSLFAEAFQEMLVRDYGTQILNALYMEREAALLRREERKRKREREDKAAAEDSKAARAAAEKAQADKEKGEGAVDMEQAGQPPEKQAGEVKEETDVTKVKEEGSKEDAPVAAGPLSSTIHNGDDAVPMEDEEGAGGEEGGDVAAPDMVPLDGLPEGAAKSVAKQKPGSRGRGRGRGRGGRGRDAKAKNKEPVPGQEASCEAERAPPPEAASQTEIAVAAQELQVTNAAAREQEVANMDAAISEPADGAAAKNMAVDQDSTESREEAPPQAARDEAAKHGGKGEATGDKSDKEAEKARDKEKKKKFKVNEELLQAFRYFDRNCTGYLRVDDMRRIINNLGLSLSLRTVKELCLNVAGGPSSSRSRADRVYYRDLTDKEI